MHLDIDNGTRLHRTKWCPMTFGDLGRLFQLLQISLDGR